MRQPGEQNTEMNILIQPNESWWILLGVLLYQDNHCDIPGSQTAVALMYALCTNHHTAVFCTEKLNEAEY